MKIRVPILFFLCAVYVVPVDATETPLPATIAKALRAQRLPQKALSVYAQILDDDTEILSLGADTPRNPASTIKVITTLAAFDVLGPDYAWETNFYVDAPIVNGRLDGNLYIRGEGDPYLVIERFWLTLKQLRQKGLEIIAGDIVLDKRFMQPEYIDPADFDDAPERAYNLNPDALLLNFQSIFFSFEPDLAKRKVHLYAYPHPQTMEIVNRLKLSHGRCRIPRLRITERNKRDHVEVSGYYSRQCGTRSVYRVLPQPSRYFYGVFEQIWHGLGGRIEGGWREDETPQDAVLVYSAKSPPFLELVRYINKYSNNVMAKQVLLTMGAKLSGLPGNFDKGLQALEEWLASRGYVFPELVIDNGTGLSRRSRISARHLAQLLRDAFHEPFMPEFLSSLPIVALDGTLRRRFADSEISGRMHLKTGTLDDVSAIAGYLLDAKGRRVVVVSLLNARAAGTRRGDRVQDEVLKWLYFRD